MYTIVDLKVHVEKFFSLIFLVHERFFSAKDLANDFHMNPPRKINLGFAKDSRGTLFIRKDWPLADKGIYINRHIYI